MVVDYPHIPYGQADFRRIRLNRWLYVDKTRFVRRLEAVHHAVLIRPRRFGKTCWVSLLENYYSRVWAKDFDAVFSGTDLGRSPTAAATWCCASISPRSTTLCLPWSSISRSTAVT